MRDGEHVRGEVPVGVSTRESQMALVLSSFLIFGTTPANTRGQLPPRAFVALQFQTSGQEVF